VVERCAEIVVLLLQPLDPLAGVQACIGLRLLGEGEKALGVAPPQVRDLTRVLQPLGSVLADRLQHPEPIFGMAEEALVDERLQDVEVGVCHLLGVLNRAATGEDREAGEEALLVLVQQLV